MKEVLYHGEIVRSIGYNANKNGFLYKKLGENPETKKRKYL